MEFGEKGERPRERRIWIRREYALRVCWRNKDGMKKIMWSKD
jgi:hypothetical protein